MCHSHSNSHVHAHLVWWSVAYGHMATSLTPSCHICPCTFLLDKRWKVRSAVQMPSRLDINSFIHELEPGNEWEPPATCTPAQVYIRVSMNMSGCLCIMYEYLSTLMLKATSGKRKTDKLFIIFGDS